MHASCPIIFRVSPALERVPKWPKHPRVQTGRAYRPHLGLPWRVPSFGAKVERARLFDQRSQDSDSLFCKSLCYKTRSRNCSALSEEQCSKHFVDNEAWQLAPWVPALLCCFPFCSKACLISTIGFKGKLSLLEVVFSSRLKQIEDALVFRGQFEWTCPGQSTQEVKQGCRSTTVEPPPHGHRSDKYPPPPVFVVLWLWSCGWVVVV